MLDAFRLSTKLLEAMSAIEKIRQDIASGYLSPLEASDQSGLELSLATAHMWLGQMVQRATYAECVDRKHK